MLVQVEVVLGIGVLDLWLEEAPGPAHRQADAGLQVSAIAVGASQAAYVVVEPGGGDAIDIDEVAFAQVAIETHELGAVGEVQACGLEGQGAIQGDLRQPLIGRDIGNGRQLVGLGVQFRGIGIATVGQRTALVDEFWCIDTEIGVQVVEVVRVADVGVVDFGQQT
ncbi:hypothetical protein D9M70_416380 [compost metagenome]